MSQQMYNTKALPLSEYRNGVCAALFDITNEI